MHYRKCPNCGSLLDPEERCSCGGSAFRLRSGATVELIDQATFMDILQRIKESGEDHLYLPITETNRTLIADMSN